MRRAVFSYSLAVCIAVSFFSVVPLQAQRQVLPTRTAAPAGAQDSGKLPDSQAMSLSIALPLRNQQQLKAFLQQLHDPSSPQYNHFLTVAQFTEKFGPTASDYEKVIAYAKSHGMTVTKTYANRMLVNVTAPVSSVNQTFHVTMHSYQHPTENRKFYAPNVEPSIEQGFSILSVHGLSNYEQPHPMLKKASAIQSYTTGSGQSGQFLGSDIRAAYAPGVTLDGTGQTVGLIELGPYNLSDVQSYFSSISQPLNVPIYNVLLSVDGICSGTPATGGCDDGEEVIDIQQAISMAPNLSALIVYEAYGANSDALTAFTQAANDNIAKQLSLSFGWGGTPSTEPGYEQIFMELQAQGQNVFVASGDLGANVGDVGYPGNSPNITDAGGTDLTTNGPGGAWLSESGWVGSGGGWSTQSPIPGYQIPVINSTNQGSPSYRNIPDVAMEANTDNYFCANGSCQGGIGGTSLAAPRWAGFLALVNEQANGNPVGFLNTTLYSVGQTSNYTNLFHDIITGNDFNSGSPDLFSAVTGYDLVTGWGTPTGQNLIDTLAPANATSPNFALTASPATIDLTPGSSGTSTITVTPTNGFNAVVNLNATVVGSPAGVTASLSSSSITGAGSSTLSVSTTSETPGGNILIAITGTGNGLSKTVYVSIALPDFSLSLTPTALYLNQSNVTTGAVSITPENGFTGKVQLSLKSSLPDSVVGAFSPSQATTRSTLMLAAGTKARTGVDNMISITGESGSITHTLSSATLSVSAGIGKYGAGVPVDLSSAYNVAGIYTDGQTFTSGGLDGGGYAYSENILTPARVLNDIQFNLGPANTLDAVYGAGQQINLPAGRFNTLQLLATGVDGNQASQTITVTYTDGTTSQYTQGFSDWYSPSGNVNEAEAIAAPYRNTAKGAKGNGPFNVYGYALLLNPAKVAKSFTLPNNRNVIILAATLASENLGTQADLTSAFNVAGIYTDGTTFASDGGIDGGGAAYSANLLGDETGPSSLVVDGIKFNIGAANQMDTFYGSGQSIALPSGHYHALYILGTGVQGDQESQTIVVTYTDGTTSKFPQNLSDWYSPQDYPREAIALRMAYRDYNDGSQNNQKFNLYEYKLPINCNKTVKSIQLPENRYVVALAITLVGEPE
jgi:hypothetical protein